MLCQLQNAKSNLESSAKFMHGRKQNTYLVHLYILLVETFVLILN